MRPNASALSRVISIARVYAEGRELRAWSRWRAGSDCVTTTSPSPVSRFPSPVSRLPALNYTTPQPPPSTDAAFAPAMTLQIALYVLAALLIVAGFAGTILPVVPGVPLVFLGMLLAAWTDGFQHVGTFTLI